MEIVSKKQKKILLINHYAGSPEMGMEFRPYYLAKEWVRDGYRVDIIAADYSHLRINNPNINKDFDENVIDGIHYHWVHTKKYSGNGFKRAMTMFEFVGKLCIHSKQIANTLNPDVIITSSTYPLDTYAGQLIRKKTRMKSILIHEIHDMWPITPIEIGGMSQRNPFIIALQMAENSFCKKSDYIVSLLPNSYDYLHEHGMDMNKFVHIPNGIVQEEWQNPQALTVEVQNQIDRIKEKHDKLICFFGSHTRSYALEYIIDAVKTFDRKKVALVMVGEGNCKEELIKRSKNADNIYFFNSIPKKSIPSLLNQVDIIYVGALNNRMFRFGICMNKLYDSMMAGKPILYAVNAPNNYIRDYNCGITVDTESTEALIDGIKQMISFSDEQMEIMGKNGKNAVLNYFTTRKLALEFEKLF